MKRWIRFSAILGAVCLSAGIAAPAEAGIIPWTYNAIFGPVGSNAGYGYTAGYRGACCGGGGVMGNSYLGPGYAFDPYGPAIGMGGGGCSSCGTGGCGPGGCGVNAFYGPGGCCSPCGFGGCGLGGCGLGGCSTGGCGAGGCANGQCDTGAASQGFQPSPESPNGPPPRPQTFANPPNPPNPAGGNYGPAPSAPASAIPGKAKEPAPAEPMPEANNDNTDSGFPGPAFGLDGKVTWRPAVQRERMELRPRYTSAKVARRTVYPKSNWVELPERHEEIAKK
jgi:hypothetical protein